MRNWKYTSESARYKDTHFGELLIYPKPLESDVIIMAEAATTGMRPQRIMLPHQVYKEKIMKMGGHVFLIPASSQDYVEVNLNA